MGDNKGKVGMGIGKANAVPDAMRKATERARKDMRQWLPWAPPFRTKWLGVLLVRAFCSSRLPSGTGVIAAGGVRAVLRSSWRA
jgi:small subunit ribosomal protein S5